MTLGEALISAWQQALGERRDEIELESRRYGVNVLGFKGSLERLSF